MVEKFLEAMVVMIWTVTVSVKELIKERKKCRQKRSGLNRVVLKFNCSLYRKLAFAKFLVAAFSEFSFAF